MSRGEGGVLGFGHQELDHLIQIKGTNPIHRIF